MLAPLLTLALAADPLATAAAWEPFALDTATIAEAHRLAGRVVRSTFKVVSRPDYREELMAIGDDTGDVARLAVVPLDLLVDAGDVVAVEGVLRVIEHPAADVNGVRVPEWTEVRIAEGRILPRPR